MKRKINSRFTLERILSKVTILSKGADQLPNNGEGGVWGGWGGCDAPAMQGEESGYILSLMRLTLNLHRRPAGLKHTCVTERKVVFFLVLITGYRR